MIGNDFESQRLHFFRLFLFLLVVIIVVLFLFILLVIRCFFAIIFFLFLPSLYLTQRLPFLGKLIGLALVISDDYVIKDCPCFHLPQIKTEETKVGIFVHRVVVLILWVGDLFRFPNTLVRWVGNTLAVPFTFVGFVIFHRCFPLPVFFVIPIVWLFGVAVHDTFFLNPIVWFFVFRIIDHGFI